MSGSALLPWKLGLKCLQRLTDNPGNVQAAHEAADAIVSISGGKRGNTLQAQTCKKLVNELKWPLHACTAAARAAQQHPKTPAVYVSVNFLQVFFSTCSMHLQATAAAGPSQLATPASSSLRRSVLQQVEASGLLHQLPALMIAAAVELSVQAKDGSFLQYSRVARGGMPAQVFYACTVRVHAEQLLKVHSFLCRLLAEQGGDQPRGWAAVGAAVMQLSLAVTRHLSAEVQAHMQQGSAEGLASCASPFDMQDLMSQAFVSVGTLLWTGSIRPGQSQQQQEAEELLLAAQLVPCLVLQLTITALALEMKGTDLQATRPEGEHQHSSSGAARPGPSSAGQRQQQQQQQSQAPYTATLTPPGAIPPGKCPCCVDKVVQTWRLACERHASLTPCHHKLFGLLGMDARAVLWAAATVRWRCNGIGTYSNFLSPYIKHVQFASEVAAQELRAVMPPQRQQLEQSLHLLLPVVLLHQLAALPPNHSSFAHLCSVLAPVSCAAVGAWEHLLPAGAEPTDMASPCLSQPAGCVTGQHLAPPPASEFGQLLRLLCTVSAGVQQHVPVAGGAAPAAAGAGTAGAAAAAAGREALNRHMLETDWAALAGCLTKLLLHAVWADAVPGAAVGAQAALQGTASPGAGCSACAEAQPPELQRGLFAVAGLPEQAVGVMRVFEGFVRRVGAAVVPGQPPPQRASGLLSGLVRVYIGGEWHLVDAATGPRQQQQQQLYVGPLTAVARAAGPGSAAQRQLFGMLVSALKLAQGVDGGTGLAASHAAAAATCAAKLLQDGGAAAASVAAAAGSAAQGGSRVGSSSSSSSSSGSSSSSSSGNSSSSVSAQCVVYLGLEEPPPPAVPCDALQQLPWAVLLGRCLLMLGQALGEDVPKLLQVQQEGGGQLTWGQACTQTLRRPTALSDAPLSFTASTLLQLGLEGCGNMQGGIGTLVGLLQNPAVADRMSEAGYSAQQLQLLQQLFGSQTTSSGDACCFAASMCLQLEVEGYSQLGWCISVLLDWLQEPAVDDRLAAAGYGPQHGDVLQQLLQLQAAREAAADSSDQAALSELVQHMQAAGHALACLAVPTCCNNPSCCVMAGGTELQLVSGKGCICAGCRTARYCSRGCQRAHWKRHKPVCQALAAAQGGGPSTASSSG